MRDDILRAFCDGTKAVELIKNKVAGKKTVYYYHSMYSDMIEIVKSDSFANEMVKLMIKMRIKEAKERISKL